jgi:hypothetical protein
VLSPELTVQVVEPSGKPARGVSVHFSSLADSMQNLRVWLRSGELADSWVHEVMRVTDDRGRASVQVRFGWFAGDAGVIARVEALGFADTARYTIRPGAPVRVIAAPRDTAVFVGNTLALRGAAIDRGNNPTSDSIRFSIESGPASMSGRLLTGNQIARVRWKAEFGLLSDSGMVSIVPRGQVMLSHYSTTDHRGLVLVDLDGTVVRAYPGNYEMPEWTPDGNRVIAVRDSSVVENGRSYLISMNMEGVWERIDLDSTALVGTRRPRLAHDGNAIYFEGYRSPTSSWALPAGEIWRVNLDGTDLVRLGEVAESGFGDHAVSSAPNGSKLVFETTRARCCGVDGRSLRILDLSTGGAIILTEAGGPMPGTQPRWMRTDADAILIGREDFAGVYGLSLHLIRPDGSFIRQVSPVDRVYTDFAFSPDESWIIARRSNAEHYELIEVRTGMTLPLPFGQGLWYAAWRPKSE